LLKFQYKMFREGQANYLTQVYTISKGKYILYMCCTYLAISCSSEGTVLSPVSPVNSICEGWHYNNTGSPVTGIYEEWHFITTLVPQLTVYVRSGIFNNTGSPVTPHIYC
jgi:hypothetical protein